MLRRFLRWIGWKSQALEVLGPAHHSAVRADRRWDATTWPERMPKGQFAYR
jgi:hypothetical protein